MPYLTLQPDFKLFYKIDDYTDPWIEPETVLFIHGANESIDAWRAWVPNMSRRYRMIRIDLRGFGNEPAAERLSDEATGAGHCDCLPA